MYLLLIDCFDNVATSSSQFQSSYSDMPLPGGVPAFPRHSHVIILTLFTVSVTHREVSRRKQSYRPLGVSHSDRVKRFHDHCLFVLVDTVRDPRRVRYEYSEAWTYGRKGMRLVKGVQLLRGNAIDYPTHATNRFAEIRV